MSAGIIGEREPCGSGLAASALISLSTRSLVLVERLAVNAHITLAPGICARKIDRVEASPANLFTATSSTEVLKWREASRNNRRWVI